MAKGGRFDIDFDKLAKDAEARSGSTRDTSPVTRLLDEGAENFMNRQTTVLQSVDPKRCRMWKYADRSAESYTEEECSDLIESLAPGREQELPALARKLKEDPDFDFELIYGGRRRWACEFNKRPLVIRITGADDVECLAKMHVENAKRKDITALERCRSFRRQQSVYSSVREMARNLSEAQNTVSRYVKAGEIWEFDNLCAIVSPRALSIQNAIDLVDARANDPDAFDTACEHIKATNTHEKLTAKAVVKLIFKTMEAGTKSAGFAKTFEVQGVGVVKVKTDAAGAITVKLPKKFLDLSKTAMGDFFASLKGEVTGIK